MHVRPSALPEDLRNELVALARGAPREHHGSEPTEGYGWKLARVAVGGLAIAGLVFTVGGTSWLVRDRDARAYEILCMVAGAIGFSGLWGIFALLVARPRPAVVWSRLAVAVTGRGDAPVEFLTRAEAAARGLPIGVGGPAGGPVPPGEDWAARLAAAGVRDGGRGSRLAWLVGLALVLGLGAGLGWGGFQLARRENARKAEAMYWSRAVSGDRPEGWDDYLEWAEALDPTVVPARYGEPAALHRAYREWSDAPYSPAREARKDEILEGDAAYWRWEQSKTSVAGEFLRRHTAFSAHVAEALTRFDDASFRVAREQKTAAALRGYRRRFPRGRHFDAAKEALRAMYRAALEKHRVRGAGPEVDAAGVEGLGALLAHLCDRDPETAVLRVAFLPVEGLEGGPIEAAMQAATGSTKVHPVGPSFSAAANAARHRGLLEALGQGLRWTVGDLFVLAEGALDETRREPRILVRYRVRGTGVPYSLVSEEALPPARRNVYVGIAIDLDFTIQVPGPLGELADDPAVGARVSVAAVPAPNFKVRGLTPDAGAFARAVYDRMAQTASDDLATSVARALALLPPPR